MTFDEMNRAMEFIIQNEAQVSVRMEEVTKRMEEVASNVKELSEFQKRDHGLLAQMAVQEQRVTALLEIQSRRLDRAEQEDRAAQKRHEEMQARFEQFDQRHKQLLQELRTGFDRVIAKLSEKPN